MTHVGVRELPTDNIMPRWTRMYDKHANNCSFAQHLARQNDEEKRKILLRRAFQLATRETKISNYSFDQAMLALSRAESVPASMNKTPEIQNASSVKIAAILPTSCPPSAFKGGRPPHAGLKTWTASMKKQKIGDASKTEAHVEDWPEEENPPLKKRRSLYEISKHEIDR